MCTVAHAELESRTNCYFRDCCKSISSTPTNYVHTNLYTSNLQCPNVNTFSGLRLT